MKSTRPSFFRNGTAGLPAESIGPWSANARQINDLRKRLEAERDPARRSSLAFEINGLLAKAAQANPAGVASPLTFDQRRLLAERQKRMPELWRVWVETLDEIMYWTAGDTGALLEQSVEEFKTAMLELIAPSAN